MNSPITGYKYYVAAIFFAGTFSIFFAILYWGDLGSDFYKNYSVGATGAAIIAFFVNIYNGYVNNCIAKFNIQSALEAQIEKIYEKMIKFGDGRYKSKIRCMELMLKKIENMPIEEDRLIYINYFMLSLVDKKYWLEIKNILERGDLRFSSHFVYNVTACIGIENENK